MSKLGKLILTATSVAPILGAIAINALAQGKYWDFAYWLVAAVGIAFVCWILLYACRTLPEEPLTTTKVKTMDKEVLSFIVIYLLPIFTKDMIFTGNWLAPAYVIFIICACIYNSNSFTFNPVLSLMRYHFYEVDIKDGMTFILISRKTLRRNDNTIQVREISDYLYLQA